jgi:hypothetical protein
MGFGCDPGGVASPGPDVHNGRVRKSDLLEEGFMARHKKIERRRELERRRRRRKKRLKLRAKGLLKEE